jgi:hypothetical protein
MLNANYTQVDLLPKDMSRDRVRTWIKDECRARGIRNMEMKDVHLLSCKNGYGVAALMKKVCVSYDNLIYTSLLVSFST